MTDESTILNSGSVDRGSVARDLYQGKEPSGAGTRAILNSNLGGADLQSEVARRLNLTDDQSILDLGCGTGLFLKPLAAAAGGGSHVVGVDFSADALEQAKEAGQPLVRADGAKLPLASASFHRLACNFAVYYLSPWQEGVRDWCRVLTPGAQVVVTGPAADTNQELYEFHRRATGLGPSDADTMALGFVGGPLAGHLKELGFAEVRVSPFTNPIRFPDANTFLDYWVATSLFARTPGARREDALACLEHLPENPVITKRVDILSATWPGQ